MPAVASPIKLSFHKATNLWFKIIGKKLSQDGTKLVQAQWYFTSDEEQSIKKALARKAQWNALKRSWADKHQKVLIEIGNPFAKVPHWYNFQTIEPEKSENALHDLDEPFGDDDNDNRPVRVTAAGGVLPQPHDISIAECYELIRTYRLTREGKDFKSESNKSFETDLRGGISALGVKLKISALRSYSIKKMREKLEDDHSGRTAFNYGMAVKRMLKWYFASEFFEGGVEPKGLQQEFAEFKKPAARTPKHLRLDVVKFIFQKASRRRKLYLILMLNTGMQPTDIPMLRTKRFNFEASTVKWYRKKNRKLRGSKGRWITSLLWPETLRLVREMIAADGRAFRTTNGEPLFRVTANRNRYNRVAKSLGKFFKTLRDKHQIKASAKNFRQTGSQLIMKVTGRYDLARIWLGREFAAEDKPYLKEVVGRLNRASMRVHRRLVRREVFPQDV